MTDLLNTIRAEKAEIKRVLEAIEKSKEKLLVPIGAGILMEVKVSGRRFLQGVGAQVFVEKKEEELMQSLRKRLEELDKLEVRLLSARETAKKAGEEGRQ